MRRDYEKFGDLVVFDTTYRTNKYGMICAPFVRMNHHCNNVMFGMGFMLNERVESFVWLFESFLSSMGSCVPKTIMTNQCLAMAGAITIVFPPTVRHRLCTWHIGENASTKIGHLTALVGFNKVFNYLLKYVETKAEFKFYWKRMLVKYQCFANKWLAKLYKDKEKWCPAFSKEYFSGGILSLQRSESTNNSLKHKLKSYHGLHDFFQCFIDVISEWRSNENGEDFRTINGNKHLAFANVSILEHACEIYTPQVFTIFQDEFLKAAAQTHLVYKDLPLLYYVVSRKIDLVKHQVAFDQNNHDVSCTCKLFTELGVLCSHILRVYHMHSVERIPEDYILKRWTKTAMRLHVDDLSRDATLNIVQPSVWRLQTLRFLVQLIISSQDIPLCRAEIESDLKLLKERIESIMGAIDFDAKLEEEIIDLSELSIKDPLLAQKKYDRNIRPKGAAERVRNKANAWRSKSGIYAEETKKKAQTTLKDFDPNAVGFIHPTYSSIYLISLMDNGGFQVAERKKSTSSSKNNGNSKESNKEKSGKANARIPTVDSSQQTFSGPSTNSSVPYIPNTNFGSSSNQDFVGHSTNDYAPYIPKPASSAQGYEDSSIPFQRTSESNNTKQGYNFARMSRTEFSEQINRVDPFFKNLFSYFTPE